MTSIHAERGVHSLIYHRGTCQIINSTGHRLEGFKPSCAPWCNALRCRFGACDEHSANVARLCVYVDRSTQQNLVRCLWRAFTLKGSAFSYISPRHMPNNKQHGPSMNTQTCQTASLAPSVPSSKSGTTRAKQRAWHHSVAISKLTSLFGLLFQPFFGLLFG